MRSTLFFIPHELAGIPLFGWGWGLIALVIACVAWLGWTLARGKKNGRDGEPTDVSAEIITGLPVWGVAAAWLSLSCQLSSKLYPVRRSKLVCRFAVMD